MGNKTANDGELYVCIIKENVDNKYSPEYLKLAVNSTKYSRQYCDKSGKHAY